MKPKKKWQNHLKTLTLRVLLITLLCSLSYIFGSYINSISLSSQTHSQTQLCPPPPQPNLSSSNQSQTLDFEPHHRVSTPSNTPIHLKLCDNNFTDYCPCQDPLRNAKFVMEKKFFRERHCPVRGEVTRCLVPRPVGYRTPFKWPESKNFAWFSNVPHDSLTFYKKSQNWVRLEGDRFVFPGGGTSFPNGVKEYVDEIGQVVPLKSGDVRTVLDVGCGVASFGASLMDFNILTMSIAPRDIHEDQVQFALERGLPAMFGILSTYRLPYPSKSFDMAHCSRCLVPWTHYDGLYLMEIDRVLRPGGYWVLSGPPIGWRRSSKAWERRAMNLKEEQAVLEDLARQLCWKKIAERGRIAVWRKPTNHVYCINKPKARKSPDFCNTTDPDAGWYKKMEACITPLPKVESVKYISGGALKKWPKRLNAVPPRMISPINKEVSFKAFNRDRSLWAQRVSQYGNIPKSLSMGKYRNIMDMNAGIGGFAAVLSKYPVWVMNVIPYHTNDTLGIIYQRGLIGTYMNWCEAFSTYPRTYDLIHADGIFSMYMDRCDILDIFLEMHRILQPEGTVIIRDHIDILVKAKGIMGQMGWNGTMQHSERGPSHPEKVLIIDNSK